MSYLLLRDGSKVEVAEIDTVEAGIDALTALDESIISIEEQLARAHVDGEATTEWAIKANTALKHRRRARPHLQERIGELRRAKKVVSPPASSERKAAWHRAFVAAVKVTISAEQFAQLSKIADEAADEAMEDMR